MQQQTTQVEAPHVEKAFKQGNETWLKVYIGDTDYINRNGWGYSDQEVIDNLNKTGIDSPGLLTNEIYHPRGLHKLDPTGKTTEELIKLMQKEQEKEGKVLWRHKSFYRDNNNPKRIYSNVLVTDAKAIEAIDKGNIPRYVSAGAYLFDQPNGKGISRKFHFLHTSIVKKPAFPFAHAIIKAMCTGPEGVCNQSLAVAGINTQNSEPTENLIKSCSLCPLDTFKELSLNDSSIGSFPLVISSVMTDNDKLEQVEAPKPEPTQVDTNAQAVKAEVQKQATKAPVQAPVSKETQATDQLAAQNAMMPPVDYQQLSKQAFDKIAEQQKIIDQLVEKDRQRDLEKRREIVSSYVNKVFEHDNKKAQEVTEKYLQGAYLKMDDGELIECLKDTFGEKVIEVQSKNKRLVKAGIEEFVTNDANLAGNTDGKPNNKNNILREFSSVIEDRRNGVL